MKLLGAIILFVLVATGHLSPPTAVSSYNVLMMMPFASRSHKNVYDPVAEELVRRGHKVTIMAPFQEKKQQPGVTNVLLVGAAEVFERYAVSFFKGTPADVSMLTNMFYMGVDMCNGTFRDPVVQDILQNPSRDSTGRPRFDLVVIDCVFGEFVLPIAHYLGVPAVYLSPGLLFPHQAWALDIPYPVSYIAPGGSVTSNPMTFTERIQSLMMTVVFTLLREWLMLPGQQKAIREVLPDSPPLLDLERNVSFVLTNTHPALHGASPKMPYYVEVGGINCHPAKPLPKDLEDFMASSGDAGVVYFSLGSYTKGESMPEDMKRKLLEAFSKLPQKVLWKYESAIEDLPPNVRLISWAPQQDLLAHPKLKLFITHGGGLSTHEAAYHGCPILGFPLSADQWGNVGHAQHAGFSEYLDWKTFTTRELLDKIQTMISEPRYKNKALELSALYHDHQLPLAHTAAYWMEYVIRHKGAPHLKSGAGHLNFFQYFLLDVIGAILLVATVVLGLSCYLLKKAVGAVCRWRCSKTTAAAKPKVKRSKKRN